MGDLEDQLDPRERAQADADLATEDYADATSLFKSASNLLATSDALAQIGLDGAGEALAAEAGRELVSAVTENMQATHYAVASVAWSTAADDLDQQAKARGEGFVAAAGHRQAEDILHGPLTEADRTHAEVAASATAALETTLAHRADELGHAAEIAARTALDQEVEARATHE